MGAEPSGAVEGPVGEAHRRTLTLINSSPVDLYYKLSFAMLGRSGADPSWSGDRLWLPA